MEYRCDAGSLGSVKKTTQGGVIVPANLTRVGVFTYDYADGTRVRELRHPDEVFKADSLETLRSAPLIIGHPAEVTPDNYAQLNKGHVDGTPKRDGDFVAADVRVLDRDTINRVDNKDLVEVSCGYRCTVTPKSGTYNGEHYDAVQSNIVYNHVGLGPKDWGRAGNDVKLRLDGQGTPWLAPITSEEAPLLPHVMEPLKTDGKPGENKPVADPTPAKTEVRADESEALRGQVAYLRSENERLSRELAEARDPARTDSLVNARVALISQALPHLGAEFKADGKSAHQIRCAVVSKLVPSLKLDGKSEDYVSGIYDQAVESAASATKALGTVQSVSPAAPHVDGNARDAVADAEAEAKYRSQNAWRGDGWLKENPWSPSK